MIKRLLKRLPRGVGITIVMITLPIWILPALMYNLSTAVKEAVEEWLDD